MVANNNIYITGLDAYVNDVSPRKALIYVLGSNNVAPNRNIATDVQSISKLPPIGGVAVSSRLEIGAVCERYNQGAFNDTNPFFNPEQYRQMKGPKGASIESPDTAFPKYDLSALELLRMLDNLWIGIGTGFGLATVVFGGVFCCYKHHINRVGYTAVTPKT